MDGVILEMTMTYTKRVLYSVSKDYNLDYEDLIKKFSEMEKCIEEGCDSMRVKNGCYCKSHMKKKKKKEKKVSKKKNEPLEKLFHTHPPNVYEKDCKLCGLCGDFCNPEVTRLNWIAVWFCQADGPPRRVGGN